MPTASLGAVRYLRLMIVAFAVATGCGRVTTTPSDSGTDGSFGAGQRSGTRLKLEYVEFDGARQVFGVRDSARQENCYFVQWSDGNHYCTPSGGNQIVFSDDKCTTKIGVGSSDPCFQPKYFVENSADCNNVVTYSRLYPAGEKRSLDRYFTMNGSVCTEHPASGNVFHALGPEIGVGELVRGTIGAPEGPGRVKARFATSPDGLRIAVLPQFDSLLGADCILGEDGKCWPLAVVQAPYYKDSTCTNAAAQIENKCVKKVVRDSDSCTFRSLGAQIQTTSAYSDSTGTCRQVPLIPNFSLFDVGSQVTLATMVRRPDDRGRRIRPIRFTELDIADRIQMYDTERKAECYPGILADDSAYCFPSGESISRQYFTDRDCTMPVEVVAVAATTSGCDSTLVPPFAIKSAFDPKSCTWSNESRPVGARHTGQLYDKTTGICAASSPLSRYYDVGPPIPLSELAKGALLVDQ